MKQPARRDRIPGAHPVRPTALALATLVLTGCSILGPGSTPPGLTPPLAGLPPIGQIPTSPIGGLPPLAPVDTQPLQPQGSITVATPTQVAGQAYELADAGRGQSSVAMLPVTLGKLSGGTETRLASGIANQDGSSIRGVIEKGHAFKFDLAASLAIGDQVVVTVTSSDGKTTTRLGPQTVTEAPPTPPGDADINQEILQAHVTFLASEANRGRESGGGALEGPVTQYIEQVWNQLGVLPGAGGSPAAFRQPFVMRRFVQHATRVDGPDAGTVSKSPGRRPNESGLAFSPDGELATVEEARYSAQLQAGSNTHNLVGLVEGSDPNSRDRYLVVGAHMDHLGTSSRGVYCGADDNGSGTAAVLAISRALIRDKSRGQGPGCNVLLVLFAGEELGLLGSQYFVTRPPVPLAKLVGMINLDMIGRLDPGQVSVFDRTPDGGYNFFHSLHDASGTVLGRVNHDMGRASSGSDHYPFFRKGVPAIFFFEGHDQNGDMNPDYHERGDVAQKIEYGKLADITKFAYRHLIAAASRR